MDVVSLIFAQLFFLLVVVAIGGVAWFAYQANAQQKKSSRVRGEKKEHKPSRRTPVPAPVQPVVEDSEPETEPETEPEPEPEPESKKDKKKNKKKAAEKKAPEKKAPVEEKKPVEKPQAKAAPQAKKAAQKAPAPEKPQAKGAQQKGAAQAGKKPVEEKKAEQVDKKKADKKKKLAASQKDFEASLAAIQKGVVPPPKPQDDGLTEVISKHTKRKTNKAEEKSNAPPKPINSEVDVSASQLPAIIGKKGETLRTIENLTGVKINVPKHAGSGESKRAKLEPDAKVTIKLEGSSHGIQDAAEMIRLLEKQGYTKQTHPGIVSETITLKDPKRDRGLLLKDKGDNLKKLQKGTFVRIIVPRELDNNELTIVGKPADCQKAREAIGTLLTEGYSTVTHRDHVRGEVEGVSPDQFKLIIGPKGATINKIQESTGAKVYIPKDETSNISIIGLESQVNKAREQIMTILAQNSTTVAQIVDEDLSSPWASVNVNSVDDQEW